MDLSRHHRKRRRALFLKKLYLSTGIFLTVMLMAWGFFWIPYIRITKIVADDYVSGSELEQAISPYLGSLNKFWLPQNNYFLFEPEKIAELIKEKEIGIASAEKKFPKTLEVRFPETEPWLIYCNGEERCYYVSPFGVLSDIAPRFSENPLPRIYAGSGTETIGDSVLSNFDISFLKSALAQFKSLNITVRDITLGDEVKFSTKENWHLLIKKNSDVGKTFADLKLLLQQKVKDDRSRLDYIDMRFENKAFYKLRD